MIKRKNISLWLPKNLAQVFRLLNRKSNKELFEHELRIFFYVYSISYMDLSELFDMVPESFISYHKSIRAISQLIKRTIHINDRLRKLIQILDFLDPYL